MTTASYLWAFAERAGCGWSAVIGERGAVHEVRHTCGLALQMWERPGSSVVDAVATLNGETVAAVLAAESPAACMSALLGKLDPLRVAMASARAAQVAP